MTDIIRKRKQINPQRNSSKINIDNYLFKEINLKQNNNLPIFSKSKNKKKKDFPLTVKKISKNILREFSFVDKKRKNNFVTNRNDKNNLIDFKNGIIIRPQSSTNLFSSKKILDDDSYVVFKKYLLGKDILLPYKSLNDFGKSYFGFNTHSNFNKMNAINSLKNNEIINKIKSNSLNGKKIRKQYNSVKSYNMKSDKKEFKKKFFSKCKDKKQLSNSNFNNNDNINKNDKLFNDIDIKIFSYKNLINKIDILTQLKKNNNSNKHFRVGNSYFMINKNSINKIKKNDFNINSLLNQDKKILKRINKKNEKNEDKKILQTINLGKKLIDNPNSILYLIYNRMKLQNDEEGNLKKYNLKQRFLDYKKDINKLEESARFELFNLKKQRAIGNEVNMKGKIISTNTFFDLAVLRGGDF